MAATASSSTPALHGQNIEDCSLRIDDDSINDTIPQSPRHLSAFPLPVTLRMYFNPTKCYAFFRLLITIELMVDNQTRPTSFFLDISPDSVRTLSLHSHNHEPGPMTSQPTRQCLHFRFTVPGSLALIGPRAVPPGQIRLATPTAQTNRVFSSLRILMQQSAIHVLLPPTADNLPLEACCQAVSRQDLFATPLRRDPGLASLRSLYQGKGGRIVDVHEELQMILSPFPNPEPSSRDCPPTYDEAASLVPNPASVTHSPQPANTPETQKGKKRPRTRSPSLASPNSSTPDYNTWAHFNLACGEREKMMAELLRRADNKEIALKKLMAETDEVTRHLTALVAAAKEREAALDNRGIVADTVGNVQVQAHVGTPSGLSNQGSSSSMASLASSVSERIQAYITTQLDHFNDVLQERGYVTADDVNDILYDDGYIQEDAMVEAIENAVDGVLDRVRDRIMDAFL